MEKFHISRATGITITVAIAINKYANVEFRLCLRDVNWSLDINAVDRSIQEIYPSPKSCLKHR
jgi:hypothetical protein